MNKRTEYINGLIKENGFTSYLEIGLGDGNNFRGVNSTEKVGVDPETKIDIAGVFKMTSDDWFTEFLTIASVTLRSVACSV